MKHLKFRAYKPVHGDDNGPVMTKPFTLGDLQDQEGFELTNGSHSSWNMFGLEHEDCVVMRFTGVADKNGKEIYEGDIIESKHTSGIVEFKEGMFGVSRDRFFTYFSNMNFSEAVVTGNVHKNEGKTKRGE